MKRLHVHVSVDQLDRSIAFFSTLFGAEPMVRKPDYAKWMLDDPRVNFAISQRGCKPGVDHFGIQVESLEELRDLHNRLVAADGPILDEGEVTCCYAKSRKAWITDPSGIAWETFLTHGESAFYGDGQERGEAPTVRTGTASNPGRAPEPKGAMQVTRSACCGSAAA